MNIRKYFPDKLIFVWLMLLTCGLINTKLLAQCGPTTYSISVSSVTSGTWLDEISWQIKNASNVVVASGGPYGCSACANSATYVASGVTPNIGPFTFFIETVGPYNDNVPTWSVSVGATVLVSGTTAGGNAGTTSAPFCVTPPPCVAPVNQPTALSFPTIGITAIGGSFTAAAGTDGYLVVRYPSGATPTNPVDGTPYVAGAALGLGTVVASGATTTFNATGLSGSTTYDFYVYSLNNSGCTGGPLYLTALPLTGSASTNAPASISSTAAGGLWNSPATWTGGVVPITGDNVTIAAGSVVTVDAAVTINNITIDGMLQWNATNNALTVLGNLTIGATGKFFPISSTGAGQSILLLGNFTNNGAAALLVSGLIFGGSGTQNLDGTGSFIGTPTKGIIFTIQMQGSGTLNINTSQNLIVRQIFSYIGNINTNNKLEIDNTAQVFGQALNTQVNNVVVTNMGIGYTTAPVVAAATAQNWAAGSVSVGAVRVNGNNVYVATVAGTATAGNAPTHTSGTATNGTLTWLWVGNTGTIGAAYCGGSLTVTAGNQYFYGGNLYTCNVGGTLTAAQAAAAPPVHTSGAVVVTGSVVSFQYVGSAATVSVNHDAATSTVRSLNITNAGSGYQSIPALVILNTGAGSGAVATALAFASIAGVANSLVQKVATSSITGTVSINSSQGVGSVTVATGGRYATTPTVGFAGPTGINLVTSAGSGYAAAPTVVVSGGTLIPGATAYVTGDFTITTAGGKVLGVVLNNTSAKYIVPPSLSFSTGSASLAFPAGCWPSATAVLNANGQLSDFTVTNAGFGYTAAPTVGLSTVLAGEIAATTPSCKIGLYNLTAGFFTASAINGTTPATTNGVHSEASLNGCIPATRRINILSSGSTGQGINFTGDINLYATTGALVLGGGPIDMGGNTLTFEHPSHFGLSSTAVSWVQNGSIVLNSISTGTLTRTFPFQATGASGAAVLNIGSGTLAAGSDITRIKITQTGAPSGTATGSGLTINMNGARSFKVDILTGTVFGTNPTFLEAYDASDALTITDAPSLLLCQSNTGLSSGWARRSASSAVGTLTSTGTRTTSTAAATGGPIVFASTMYFAWGGRVLPPPLDFVVTRTTANAYTSIATIPLGGNGTGTASTATGDEGTQTIAFPAGMNFSYQGVFCTGFTVHTNGYISLANELYTPALGSSWDNSFASAGNGFTGTSDFNKRNIIAPMYDDYNKSGTVIYYKFVGNVATIEWFNTTFFGLSGPQIFFQIVLDGSDNSIKFNYGNMQLYNGTQNVRYSYGCGVTGSTISNPPLPGQIFAQQYENTSFFSHENVLTASWGANGLAISPEPRSSIKFTPGTYVPGAAPSATPPANDEYTGAFELPILNSFPNNIAWNNAANQSNLYTSRFATNSPQPICGGPADAKDVWFKFTASTDKARVRIYPSGGYLARMEVLDAALQPLATPVCIAEAFQGKDTTIFLTGLTPAAIYYVRVYHNRTGIQATATATLTAGAVSALTFTNGTNYSIPATAYSGYNPHNQGPRVSFSGGGGTGAAAALTTPTTPTQVLASMGTGNINLNNGGVGYTTPPTVTIESPDWGITGEFGLIVFIPAANDDCADAVELTNLTTPDCNAGQNARFAVSTGAATASGQTTVCGTPDDDVWYKFTAVATQTTVRVQGSAAFDPAVQIYNGGVAPGSCGTLTSLSCLNATGIGGTESSNVTTIIGNTYYLRIYHSGVGSVIGETFDVCVSSAPPVCATDFAPDNVNICATGIVLSWTAPVASPVGASGYDVYLDAGAGPATTLVSSNQAGTTYNVPGTISEGLWTWRVAPRNVYGANTGCANTTFTASLVKYYRDFDNDNYGSLTNTTLACAGPPPLGYVNDSTDCNDNDVTVHTPQTYYSDYDGDGYSPGTTTVVCSSVPPAGYIVTSLGYDCQDTIPTINTVCCDSCGANGGAVKLLTKIGKIAPAVKMDMCTGDTMTYTVGEVMGTVACYYQWKAPAGASIISGQGTTSVQVLFTSGFPLSGDTIKVFQHNGCGNSPTAILLIKHGVNKDKIAITAGSNTYVDICPGETQVYNATVTPGGIPLRPTTGYVWSTDTSALSISGGQGTSSASVIAGALGTAGGSIFVYSQNACGSIAPKSIKVKRGANKDKITFDALQNKDGICPGETRVYSISIVPSSRPVSNIIWSTTGATGYTLQSGQNTLAATFLAGPTFAANTGVVSVVTQNACGILEKAKESKLKDGKAPKGVLSVTAFGMSGLCDSLGKEFTANGAPVPGIGVPPFTYKWSLDGTLNGSVVGVQPQASNIGTVNFTPGWTTGNVQVQVVNGCGESSIKKMKVTAKPADLAAGTLTGPATLVINGGSTGVYTLSGSSAGATGYVWTGPKGSTLIGGIHSPKFDGPTESPVDTTYGPLLSITVSIGAKGGPLKVYPFNNCAVGKGPSATIGYSSSKPGDEIGEGLDYIQLFPNPAHDRMNVTFYSGAAGKYGIAVYDALGKVVLQQNGASVEGTNQTELNVSGLASGVYQLIIVGGDKQYKARFVVE